MAPDKKMRILVSPLDWGLGHATRCIPLIRSWREEGHEVVLAAEGDTAALMHEHFPDCRMEPLHGYRIHYSARLPLLLSLLIQIPKILLAINYERRWLYNLLQKEHFDLVVSDNRYGLHSSKTKCVIITHQLFVRVPSLLRFLQPLIHRQTQRFISAFDECWIPDKPGTDSLSGELSQKKPLPARAKFIGWLSRFNNSPVAAEAYPSYDHVIVLSGPEPQRTVTESKLIAAVKTSQETVLMVQGKPQLTTESIVGNIHIVSHLHDAALKHAFHHAKKITCRAGYSTLMDLAVMGKLGRHVYLLPTPGQTEQEYLAARLVKNEVVGGFFKSDKSSNPDV